MPKLVTMCWNVENFAHFDELLKSSSRWPKTESEFFAKASRIAEVILACGRVDLIFVIESTRKAVEYLANTHFPDFDHFSVDMLPPSTHEVGVIHRRSLGMNVKQPIVARLVPRESRPVLVIDWIFAGQHIRFYGCHWVSRRASSSVKYRRRMADFLADQVEKFLSGPETDGVRNAVVLGDFNVEPFESELSECLASTRSRTYSRRGHFTDSDVARTRLYNTAWRLMGETKPHNGANENSCRTAGSYFYSAENSWHTFDQILVSSGLVSDSLPYLDESQCTIVDLPVLLDNMGRPKSFEYDGQNWIGCSDHLPVSASINYGNPK